MNTVQSATCNIYTGQSSCSAIMKGDYRTYNNDGYDCMDKVNTSNDAQYTYNDNVIRVERYFDEMLSISEILKTYIMEQPDKFSIPNGSKICYNSDSNTAVANFSERRNR